MQQHDMKDWVQKNCTNCPIDCILWQKEAVLYPCRNRQIHTPFDTCPKDKAKLLKVVISLADPEDAKYMHQKYGDKQLLMD
jgi:hypothetical protein